MPIQVRATTHRLDDAAFRRIAFDVMSCVFDIHNEFGRFFDEKIYKRELGRRFPGTELEVPIEVRFESFCKLYFLDVLVGGGGVFEFKAVESLTSRHRSQLLQYLMAADLSHGKLVNMRTELVQHEFVNTKLHLSDRTGFEVRNHGWQEIGDKPLLKWFVAFLRDIGTCLDISMYEDALSHLLGGEERVTHDIEVVSGGKVLGLQKFRLVAPGVAFKVTALPEGSNLFEIHARRLLEHTRLERFAIAYTVRSPGFSRNRPALRPFRLKAGLRTSVHRTANRYRRHSTDKRRQKRSVIPNSSQMTKGKKTEKCGTEK